MCASCACEIKKRNIRTHGTWISEDGYAVVGITSDEIIGVREERHRASICSDRGVAAEVVPLEPCGVHANPGCQPCLAIEKNGATHHDSHIVRQPLRDFVKDVMGGTFDRTQQARSDLLEIGRFIAQDKPVAARRWVARLRQKAQQAAEMPMTGRKVPELDREDVREVLLGSYRIVYLVCKKEIRRRYEYLLFLKVTGSFLEKRSSPYRDHHLSESPPRGISGLEAIRKQRLSTPIAYEDVLALVGVAGNKVVR